MIRFKIFLAIFLISVPSILPQTRYDVIELCTLTGASYVAPFSINDSSYVVGFLIYTGNDQIAFRYKDGVVTDLGNLGYAIAKALAININNKICGWSYLTELGPAHAFLYSNGNMIDIGSFSGDRDSWATDINKSDKIVGYYYGENTGEVYAFLYNNGAVTNLGSLGGIATYAQGINDSDYIVGSSSTSAGDVCAFLYHNGQMTNLGVGGNSSAARDINSLNKIVGFFTIGSADHAFLYDNGIVTDLGPGWAQAINDSGLIVGYVQGAQGQRAILWKNGQAFDLNQHIDPASGWTLLMANDINNLGEIVCIGFKGGAACGVILKPGLEILEPKANDKWIAGEQDTIKWTGGKTGQLLEIKMSKDSGNTFIEVHFLIPGSSGRYIWTPGTNFLSKKCLITITDMNDPNNADTSDIFKIKPYILTRDSSGQYERYRQSEDQWGFSNSQNDFWPQVWYQQFDYQGIDPFTGSQYSQWQANFTFASSLSEEYVDWVSWVNMLTTNACYISTTLGIYKPSSVFAWNVNKMLPYTGSCFGIATSNALAFQVKNAFLTYYPAFPPFANPISVTSNDGVKIVVNELFAHQYKLSHWNYRHNVGMLKTPSQTLEELKEMFKDDETNIRILAFLNNNGSGGHAVIPVGLERDVNFPNLFWLNIYDSNFPNQTKSILIDPSANGGNGNWAYFDMPRWGGNKWIYLNDYAIDYLDTPINEKKNTLQSPFLMAGNDLQIFNRDSTFIRIIDASGNATGFYNDSIYTDIPGSAPSFILDGKETLPIGYLLQPDNYTVILNEFANENVSTDFFINNKIFSYKRSDAAADQTDRLFFDGGVSVSNPNDQTKTIQLSNLLNENNQEKLSVVKSIELAQNDSVKIENPDSNKIKLISYGSAKDYDIELNFVTENGVGRFGASDIQLTENTTHTFVPDWENVFNTQLTVLVDFGNDGTIDDTLHLNNTVDVEDEGNLLTPNEYNLAQNYPNPFNPVTTIRYSIPKQSGVMIKVYDVLGNEVATLVEEQKEPGVYSVNFDGSQLASGIYFYKLQTGSFTETKKMILLR